MLINQKHLLLFAAIMPSLALAEWNNEIELGFMLNQGNTQNTHFDTRYTNKLTTEKINNTFSIASLIDIAKDNETSTKQKTAEKYSANNNVKYILSNNHYLFSDLYAQKDKFSAFDYEVTESVGYGRKIFDNDIVKWHLETGPGGRHSRATQADLNHIHQDELILHSGSGLIFKLNQKAAFSQDITHDMGKNIQSTKATTALKATVLDKVSLKLSHRLEYNAKIPDTGKSQKHAENTTSITATYMF